MDPLGFLPPNNQIPSMNGIPPQPQFIPDPTRQQPQLQHAASESYLPNLQLQNDQTPYGTPNFIPSSHPPPLPSNNEGGNVILPPLPKCQGPKTFGTIHGWNDPPVLADDNSNKIPLKLKNKVTIQPPTQPQTFYNPLDYVNTQPMPPNQNSGHLPPHQPPNNLYQTMPGYNTNGVSLPRNYSADCRLGNYPPQNLN